jgi:hypothetical protein
VSDGRGVGVWGTGGDRGYKQAQAGEHCRPSGGKGTVRAGPHLACAAGPAPPPRTAAPPPPPPRTPRAPQTRHPAARSSAAVSSLQATAASGAPQPRGRHRLRRLLPLRRRRWPGRRDRGSMRTAAMAVLLRKGGRRRLRGGVQLPSSPASPVGQRPHPAPARGVPPPGLRCRSPPQRSG